MHAVPAQLKLLGNISVRNHFKAGSRNSFINMETERLLCYTDGTLLSKELTNMYLSNSEMLPHGNSPEIKEGYHVSGETDRHYEQAGGSLPGVALKG